MMLKRSFTTTTIKTQTYEYRDKILVCKTKLVYIASCVLYLFKRVSIILYMYSDE